MTQLVVSVQDREWPAGRCTVVMLSGEADVTDPALADVLSAQSARDPALLVVDLSGLTFMDSSAQRVLLRAARAREAAGRTLCLVNPAGEVRRLLELTGADQMLPLFGSVQEAMGIPDPGPTA